METPLITYNLKDRGRQYRGKERNFHLQKIAAAINSPETQERVKHRDMLGYYGHWPRVRFGMNPCEGDAVQPVQPAIVTTHLEASDDGTVKHKAEFLGTKPGQIAAQLFASRTGGFSSAIDEGRPEFFGFDYVLEPNYSSNRGYQLALDSVTGNLTIEGMTLDDIMTAEYNDQLDGVLALVSKLDAANRMALESLSRLSAENEELLSMLSSPALDSVSYKPFSVSKDPARQLINDMNTFKTAPLPSFIAPPSAETPNEKRLFNRLLRHGY